MKRKTSTEIDSIARFVGEEKAVEYVAKAGFDAWDFSMFAMCRWNWNSNCPYNTTHILQTKEYLSFARKLKKIGLDNGIVCNQSHAPFPSDAPIMLDLIKRAIECTAEVGAEICVVHPANHYTPQENAEFYHKILPFAKEHNVKIATENMWDWDVEKNVAKFAACATSKDFNAVLDAANDDYLVACLDIGHAEMMGEMANATELIYALGNRLKALHIHDNDKWKDSHQIPFSMKIDFASVAKALKNIGYDGYFTLEADCYLRNFAQDDVFNGVKRLAESVNRFNELFEGV